MEADQSRDEMAAVADLTEEAMNQAPDFDEDTASAEPQSAAQESADVADDAIETDELLEIDDAFTETESGAENVSQDEDLDVVIDEFTDISSSESDEEMTADDDLDVVVDESDDQPRDMVSDMDLPEDKLLEIDDELPQQTEDDDLDVVLDESIPDLEAIISQADRVDDELTENDDLLDSVSLDDKDVADLEAAGLTDIVDLDTEVDDELPELDIDEVLEAVEASMAGKDREDSQQDSTVRVEDLDEQDIDKLLNANKNA